MEYLRDWLMAGIVHDTACIERRARWPQTYREYAHAFARFGVRIRLMPRWVIPEPQLRNCVLYLPIPRNQAELKAWLCHELAHAIMGWEGVPLHIYPAAWGDHERFARMVEEIIAHRRAPRPETWRNPLLNVSRQSSF